MREWAAFRDLSLIDFEIDCLFSLDGVFLSEVAKKAPKPGGQT